MKRAFSNMGRFSLRRIKSVPEKDNGVTGLLMVALFIATTITGIIEISGNPLGASFIAQLLGVLMAIGINMILFPLVTYVLALLFSFIYIPLPRLFLGSLSYSIIANVYILHIESSGTLFSYLIGIGYSVAAVLVGLFFIVLFQKRFSHVGKITVLSCALILVSMYFIFVKIDYQQSAIPVMGNYNETITAENPGKPGAFDYTFLTYGSGDDIQRDEYGADVDELTASVDSSHFITKWSQKREKFWGFTPESLPINGRAFLPEGEGEFPVFLMVHGNHTMEYFSTAGYDYLGELLASRGIIAISVDEDFINYSNRLGIPNDNYELRAWMILQHLATLQDMNEDPESAFFGKVDFGNVALMGHSRGGQAALMAADYQTYFEEDDLNSVMHQVNIQGVVAISPTDKKVGDAKPTMHNISYLALHGARDADVSTFRGDQQFYRTTFDPQDDGFKSTLYIAEANHTQFNTDWGRMDLSLPRGLFLSQAQTMAPEDQRDIAKVYVSAFLETIFNEEKTYEKLFEDYRNGSDWLPETALVSKYQHASYLPLVQFKQNAMELIDAEGFREWRVMNPKDRDDSKHPVDAMELKWEADAHLIFPFEGADLNLLTGEQADRIVLRMANNDENLKKWRRPEIDVELKTTDGVMVRLPLDDFMPFPEVITTDYTVFGLFDNLFRDGKYGASWEPTFQTFEIPLAAFEAINPDFVREDLKKLKLHFKSGGGNVLLEEIGVW